MPSQSLGMIPIVRCRHKIKRGDVARFRAWLNYEHAGERKHQHGRFKQKIRQYGDYLYSQDHDKFMAEMCEWLPTRKEIKSPNNPEQYEL